MLILGTAQRTHVSRPHTRTFAGTHLKIRRIVRLCTIKLHTAASRRISAHPRPSTRPISRPLRPFFETSFENGLTLLRLAFSFFQLLAQCRLRTRDFYAGRKTKFLRQKSKVIFGKGFLGRKFRSERWFALRFAQSANLERTIFLTGILFPKKSPRYLPTGGSA